MTPSWPVTRILVIKIIINTGYFNMPIFFGLVFFQDLIFPKFE